MDYYLLLLYCRRQGTLLPPIWAESLTKFNTIKIISIGFQIKYLVLSNCSEHAQNVIQWHQNSFFFQKITKNHPVAGGFAPRLPSVIRLSYFSLLTHVFYFRHFCFLTIGLNPTFHLANTSQMPNSGHGRTLFHKKSLFRKFLITTLHVICSLGPLIKNPGYA